MIKLNMSQDGTMSREELFYVSCNNIKQLDGIKGYDMSCLYNKPRAFFRSKGFINLKERYDNRVLPGYHHVVIFFQVHKNSNGDKYKIIMDYKIDRFEPNLNYCRDLVEIRNEILESGLGTEIEEIDIEKAQKSTVCTCHH